MRRTTRRGGAVLGGALLLLLAGCGSTPPSRFYALAPLTGDAAGEAVEAGVASGPTVGLALASLPEEVDRPQMLLTLDANRRRLDEFSRWASPLREHLALVLRRNLEARLGAGHVFDARRANRPDLDYHVAVEVLAFDAVLDGPCTLEARVHVADRAGAWRATLPVAATATGTARGAAGVAEAMSVNLAVLGDAIAEAVRD